MVTKSNKGHHHLSIIAIQPNNADLRHPQIKFIVHQGRSGIFLREGLIQDYKNNDKTAMNVDVRLFCGLEDNFRYLVETNDTREKIEVEFYLVNV